MQSSHSQVKKPSTARIKTSPVVRYPFTYFLITRARSAGPSTNPARDSTSAMPNKTVFTISPPKNPSRSCDKLLTMQGIVYFNMKKRDFQGTFAHFSKFLRAIRRQPGHTP